MNYVTKMHTHWLCALLLFSVFGCSTAQQVTTFTPVIPEQEKAWQSCEGGYYTGPRAGRKAYSNDKYLWTVTPAFAKRFCMPESFVSHELTGAEAIAFRMVDGADWDRCGINVSNIESCIENGTARFEIYLSQSLNLPAANPQVKFFEGARTTSDWHLSNLKVRENKGQAYRKGQYTIPPGAMPRFSNPYAHPDPGYHFLLIYSHKGKSQWPVAALGEVGFRGDWVVGIDALALDKPLVGFNFESEKRLYDAAKLPQGNKDGQYLIVMDKRDSQSNTKTLTEKIIPDDFGHVITLPHAFGQQVRMAALQGGVSWIDYIKSLRNR